MMTSDEQTKPATAPAPNYFHGSPPKKVKPFADGPKSLMDLTKWLKLGLLAFIGVSALQVCLRLFIILDYPGFVALFTPFSPAPNWPYWALVGYELAFYVIFIFCTIMSCRVIYRAMRNLHTVDSPHVKMTPAAAVGWYFVPFANFFKPAEGMAEIVAGSQAASGQTLSDTSVVYTWWVPFILSVFLGNLQLNIGNFIRLTVWLELIAALLGIVAGILFIRLTKRIARQQEELRYGGIANVFT